MHVVDIVALCVAAALIVGCLLVLARQRYMLRVAGAIPLAVHNGKRWQYGVARYVGGELRWYRSLGMATRPSRVFRRGELRIVGHRRPAGAELSALPAAAVIVDCQVAGEQALLALGEGAFTGFISWIEASSPAA